ncbi:polysaccharide deacetylase family protein [Asaccharospora irregularis]|uniref:Peptidoglycan/xylan/chitin deacetylase, PgdA/CDA1 family n=1 Tax=Asaccharospora irregularis DSM 2635 TaxID=1121321 RepID=A0A1M5PY17_9FIRM|nr:polysaccharide deacetylase family protein [Asaccharospora irregularis]SHH06897.1 Peptidoglycan/xylan/chitin deacetylase, PgdA/CDA1 family [Asaccharospora irregularis DSM 2635]
MNRTKLSKTKLTVVLTILLTFIVGATVVVKNTAEKKRLEKLEAEKERIRLEKIEKEKNEPIIGAKKNSVKKYGFDAKEIYNKLSTFDYSNNGEKVVFLTFDDGPSTTNTPKVLDTLNKHSVKATFFIKGDSLESNGAPEILKRTFDEGHAIAHHSYSHNYKTLYPNRSLNLDNFVNEINQTDMAMKKVLGDKFSSRVLRCPGGYMSWKNMDPLKNYLTEHDMASIDWNALNADAEGKKKDYNELFEFAKESSKDKEIVVILMHDTYGKEETVKSLDLIIPYFKENGYKFKILV